MIRILNEDCFDTMKQMSPHSVDVVLTSPFYNTNKKAGKTRTLKNTKVADGQYDYVRYDSFVDDMTDEEYSDFTKRLFLSFDNVLSPNGCILYNINYGAENTEGMFKAIYAVITETPFTIADVIVWKKPTALPNSCSSNRLTRIWEFVFVFCRRSEMKTFRCNKQVKSYRKTGQAAYENIPNLIEARNNDGSCPLNKATYSTELCEKLLASTPNPAVRSTTPSWVQARQPLRVCGWGLTASGLKSVRRSVSMLKTAWWRTVWIGWMHCSKRVVDLGGSCPFAFLWQR